MANRFASRLLHLGLAASLLSGCAGLPNLTSPTPTRPLPPTPFAVIPSPSATAEPRTDEIVLHGGHILTMDANEPQAQAVLLRGQEIVAVGSDADIMAEAGPQATQIDLKGKVLVPGFIDSHQHRIGDRSKLGYTSADPLIESALEQGWTTLDELYVDQGRLNELTALDASGVLRLRVNAYLPVMENSAEGKHFDPYYDAYKPGQTVSPHVRVAGLKVFTDFDNANILLWNQPDLNAFLLKEHRNGWQLAVKTVSTRSLDMILRAFESIRQLDPSIVDARGRLEHMLFATPDQIRRIKDLGLIPSIQTNDPGQLVGDPDIDALIAREPAGSYTPWRSLVQAGIPIAGGSAFPSYYVDEPSGAPFGSPMHLIYQGITRVGNLGRQPYPWLLDQTITAEDVLRALTINAAYATSEDNIKGSVSPGKLADLVILSDNPLTVPAAQINSIQALVTMVGGKVEWCAPGSEPLCPGGSAPPAQATPGGQVSFPLATASKSLPDQPPSNALDGDLGTIWGAGSHPEQWIQVDLGQPSTVTLIRLVTSQYPDGETIHQVWAGPDADHLQMIYEFKGNTTDSQTLEHQFPDPLPDIRIVRIVTTQSPSWVAWREIQIR